MKNKPTTRLVIAALGAALAWANPTIAADYPTKPIKIIVPYTPGGAVDIMSRTVGDKLSGALGQPVVMENRPGAGAAVGTEFVAKSPADGYTLLVCTVGAMTINTALYKDLRYNPLKDFEGISLMANHALVMIANSQLGVKTAMELVNLAKAKPGSVSGGYPGNGTTAHVALAFLNRATGAGITPVPYRASTQVTTADATGELQMAFIDILPVLPFARSGAVRVLAIVGPDRTAIAPEVPTFDESGLKGFDFVTWSGFFAPAGTPKDAIARLNQEIRKILADPEMKKRAISLGAEAVSSAPDEPMARVRREIGMWVSLVRDAGAKVD